MEKMLTDEEIVKALEICSIEVQIHDKNDCKECPYVIKKIDCVTGRRSERDTLDLIHRLQAENERLTEENKCLTGYIELFEKGEIVSPITHDKMLALEKDNYELQEENGQFKGLVSGLEYENAELQKQVDELKEEQKNLDWYKMWHKKFKKEIDDLTLELETYRPTKLSGHGQCKCSNCGCVSWTDWFSRYKGKTLCDRCLKEIISTEETQAAKDTAKEK